MSNFRVIPKLLIDCDGGLVVTEGFRKRRYVGDPLNAVRIFNKKHADELLILFIDASSRGKKPDFGFVREVVEESYMPVTIGGGLSDSSVIDSIFSCGIERVSINTAITNGKLCRNLIDTYGAQSIIGSLDFKSTYFGRRKIIRPGKPQLSNIRDEIQRISDLGVGELHIGSVNNDGTWRGVDPFCESLKINHLSIPVIYSGGIGNIGHFDDARLIGFSGVAVGSFFCLSGKGKGVLITYPKLEDRRNAG